MAIKKEVTYHEFVVSFTLCERELPDMLQGGTTSDQQAMLEEGNRKPLEVVALMIRDALSGNDMGCAEIEDLVVAIDGEVVHLD